jgi:hypothetical protein
VLIAKIHLIVAQEGLVWLAAITLHTIMSDTKLVIGAVMIVEALGLAALTVLADGLVTQGRTVFVLDTVVAFRVRVLALAGVCEFTIKRLAAIVLMVVAFVWLLVGLALACLTDPVFTHLTGLAVAAVVAFTFFALSILANAVVKAGAVVIGLAGGTLRIRVLAPAVLARAQAWSVAVRFAVVAEVFVASVFTSARDAVAVFANFIVSTMLMFAALANFARSFLAHAVLDSGAVRISRTRRALRVGPCTRALATRLALQWLSSHVFTIVTLKGRFG